MITTLVEALDQITAKRLGKGSIWFPMTLQHFSSYYGRRADPARDSARWTRYCTELRNRFAKIRVQLRSEILADDPPDFLPKVSVYFPGDG